MSGAELGASHPLAIKCATRLAWMLYRNQNRGEAYPLAEQAYLSAEGAPGIEAGDMLSVMTLVAFHRGSSERKDYAGGEKILQRALKLVEERHGPVHLQTVRARANLAVYYFDRRMRSGECGRLFDEVLGSYRRVLGESHERTLVARGNVGLFNEREGRPAHTQYHYLKILEHQPESRRPLEILPGLLEKLPLDPVIPGEPSRWRMMTNAPRAGWQKSAFDDSSWETLAPNVGDEAWFRGAFALRAVPSEPFVFVIQGGGDFEVFINDRPAGTRFARAGNSQLAVAQADMIRDLRNGENVIAIHGRKLRPAEELRISVGRFPPEPGD
jgi:hypothetical protein